jgi:CRISPR-associated endonuclease/helicase Cas3
LEPPTPAASRTFVELTGSKWTPTDAQKWAAEVELPSGPTLFLLEDVMGAGKTEAAQVLVHRLMASGRASGAFWALPTQATANAMYVRQGNGVRALFDDLSRRRPSLVLAHSKSRMHQGFRDTVMVEPGPALASAEADDSDLPSEVACAAFLANSSRAALMADVGAGTVDQAVLAVLPSKFNTLRLFGLAEKVLVLDEIHAYDAYMSEELRALLRFHAALGGCVVALSATLSSKLSGALAEEWQRATRGQAIDSVPTTAAYPLATVVGGDGSVVRSPIRAADWSRRRIPVRTISDENIAIDRLLSASRAGAAVVWVRNTVDSCRAAAANLRERGAEDVSVFHARFAQIDRQGREEDVLARFGRAPSRRRAGSILVATQVVEQSLDLDFDVMLSDLAPVDLLVQRSGRLWRHAFRTKRLGADAPELLVLAPEFENDPPDSWLDALLPNTRWVYQDSGVLWRTLRALRSTGCIDTPDGLRDLIARVYDDSDCPEQLQRAADRADGRARAATATARQYTLRIDEGYVDNGLVWSSDTRVPTRLGDHQLVVRLGRTVDDGRIVPWADEGSADGPTWHGWALSEIRVSRRRLPPKSQPLEAYRVACDAARATWGRWEKEIPLAPLRLQDGRWVCAMIGPDGESIEMEYDAHAGLAFTGKPVRR